MNMPTVRNIRLVVPHLTPNSVYIGREKGTNKHFGNPFSHKRDTLATIVLPTREDAIQAFSDWLSGKDYQEVEPEHRQWILDNLHTLKGKTLLCWCAPLPCHGDVLLALAN